MQVEFLAPARAEFREAIAFYNAQRAGLGSRLSAEIKKAIQRILSIQRRGLLFQKRARRCRVNRFPFGVIYQVREDTLLIVAVMHLHREPDSWRHRLDQ